MKVLVYIVSLLYIGVQENALDVQTYWVALRTLYTMQIHKGIGCLKIQPFSSISLNFFFYEYTNEPQID
jgi:hypothetical protein